MTYIVASVMPDFWFGSTEGCNEIVKTDLTLLLIIFPVLGSANFPSGISHLLQTGFSPCEHLPAGLHYKCH